jgi:MFS family permease
MFFTPSVVLVLLPEYLLKKIAQYKIYILLCISKYFYKMKSDTKSIEDLKAIRKIMEESSRFLSLSGLSGVFAGATAIAGALVAYFFILGNGNIKYDDYFQNLSANETLVLRWQLMADAFLVLVLSVLFALYFSIKKAKRDGKSFWTPLSKRLLINLLIPLVTGGVFIIVFLLQNNMQLVVPGFLIFYGLALVNAGKFTFSEVYYLGIMEIITGLVSAFVPGWSLIFWIFGFGILHIIYGLVMFRKYEA